MNAADAPKYQCTFCRGKGHDAQRQECAWCDGLGAIFSSIVFRGHPSCEGQTSVIEGCCPVTINFTTEGRRLHFSRAEQAEPPNYFVKEDGHQVYRFVRELEPL